MGVSIVMGDPPNGWFTMEDSRKTDDDWGYLYDLGHLQMKINHGHIMAISHFMIPSNVPAEDDLGLERSPP